MAITALLDASVLYPLPLRDTLLRAAQVGIYDPCWSERIFDEVERNLVRNGVADATAAARMLDAMRGAFDIATVPSHEIERLEQSMTNDPKDRHVLAAAVAAEADVIVTLNLRDFPDSACDPLSIESIHPDDFLLELHRMNPSAVQLALSLQAAALTHPAMTVADILDRLEATAPRFAGALRTQQS